MSILELGVIKKGDNMTTINRGARQENLVDSSIFDTSVCLIGAGGIGSFTALALAKIGFKNIKKRTFSVLFILPYN